MAYAKNCQYSNDINQDNHVFRNNRAKIQKIIQQELERAIQENVIQQEFENKKKTKTTNTSDQKHKDDVTEKNIKTECKENTRVCINGEEHDEKIDSLLLFAADMVKQWLGYENSIKYRS